MAKASVTETRRVRYEDDLYAWTQEQASFLRGRQSDGLDWANLADAIAAVGGSDRRKLESRLCVVLLHLLKWQAQPGLRGASWRKTLRTQRREIRKLLQQSPSLRRHVPDRSATPAPTRSRTQSTNQVCHQTGFLPLAPTRPMMC
jgi:hypothetical protein